MNVNMNNSVDVLRMTGVEKEEEKNTKPATSYPISLQLQVVLVTHMKLVERHCITDDDVTALMQ